MTVIIISIIAAWILFSALLVTVICMNSSRLSRNSFLEVYQQKMKEWAEEYDKETIQMTQAEFDAIYDETYAECIE